MALPISKKLPFIVLDDFVLNSKISQSKDHELWGGRHRKSNERIQAIIFLSPLSIGAKKEIESWITCSSYRMFADKMVRYLRLFREKLKDKQRPDEILIFEETGPLIPLGHLLKTQLTIYDRIRYFHQLVRIFYSLHGVGIYHGNLDLNNGSILWNPKTKRVKVFKDPLEIRDYSQNFERKKNKQEEYQKCRDILSELLEETSEYEPSRLGYMTDILQAYSTEEPSPKDIYVILVKALDEVHDRYKKFDQTPSSTPLVMVLSAFKNLQIPIDSAPLSTTTPSLLKKLHDVCPLLSEEIVRNSNQQTFKILAFVEGVKTPPTSSVFVKNVIINHAILKDIEGQKNTEKFLEYIEDKQPEKEKMEILLKSPITNGETLDPILDIGFLEEYRNWCRERNLLYGEKDKKSIHNTLIDSILMVDKWFYEKSPKDLKI